MGVQAQDLPLRCYLRNNITEIFSETSRNRTYRGYADIFGLYYKCKEILGACQVNSDATS